MSLDLVNANAVIVAHHFNPSITDQIWLSEKGVLAREEIAGSFVFSDMVVEAPGKEFHLLIVPDRCQITPLPDLPNQQEIVSQRLGRLVDTLPHTPFRAVGINFMWHWRPIAGAVEAFVRARFLVEGSPLHRRFQDGSPLFGGYLSKDFAGSRLKLDIKPAKGKTETETFDFVQFAFNINHDLQGADPVTEVHRVLDNWDAFKQEAFGIVRDSLEGFEP